MNFKALEICDRLVDVVSGLGITSPTEIQEVVIPKILLGDNLLVTSQTGSGKTLAYLLPLIQKISSKKQSRVLILVPTRELAQQISRVGEMLCKTFELKSVEIYGGVEYEPQIDSLSQDPHIIIATPGRLIDLLGRGALKVDSFDYFVLDEVDQMLDLGFRDPIFELSNLRGEGAQTLCFSATFPEKVKDLAETLVSSGVDVVSMESQSVAVELIEQSGYFVSSKMMDPLLIHLLREERSEHAIIFTRSRKMADRLAIVLRENGFTAEAMHSDRSQKARNYIIERFRGGETAIVVATDVMARGLDIDCVTHVFNYGLPQDVEQYVHRIGRTGRAGREGRAITLTTPAERTLLDATCRFMKQNIPMNTTHPYMSSDVTKELSGLNEKRKKKTKRNR